MGQRSGPGLSPGFGDAQAWCFFRKAWPPSFATALARLGQRGRAGAGAVLCCAALRFAVSASNGVSGHFADNTRSLLGLMQWN